MRPSVPVTVTQTHSCGPQGQPLELWTLFNALGIGLQAPSSPGLHVVGPQLGAGEFGSDRFCGHHKNANLFSPHLDDQRGMERISREEEGVSTRGTGTSHPEVLSSSRSGRRNLPRLLTSTGSGLSTSASL